MGTTTPISRSEWYWVFFWSALIVLITALPALAAWWQTPANWHYTGQILAPADGNSYLTKMKQGAEGQWLFSIAYTSEPHQPAFLFPYYIWLGKISQFAGLPLNFTFQVARVLNSWLLLTTIYLFIAEFWSQQSKRQIVFFFVAVSSGLGWIFVFFGLPTIDLRVSESITFHTMLANPHFPLAILLVLLSLLYGMRALRHPSWKYAALSGLTQAALFVIHPYDIAITGVILAVYFCLGWQVRSWWSWKRGLYLGLSWLICLPVFLYYFYLFMQPGIWRSWQTQPLFAPSLLNVGLGYGFLLILAGVGGYSLFQEDDHLDTDQARILLIWIAAISVIILLPLAPIRANQVRFFEGMHIPISMLAAQGLFVIWGKRSGQVAPPLKVWGPILVLLSFTNWLILASAMYRLKVIEMPWFYMQNEVVAMRWLNQHSRPADVVLTLDWTGNYLPAQANVHVYVGHIYETINFEKKVDQATAFFSNTLSQTEASAFLQENSIDWVFVGQQELEAGFSADDHPYLSPAFETEQAAVYRVEIEYNDK